MESLPQYIKILNESLAVRQAQNSSYSMRAFSRDLNIHPSTLSQILKGKRDIPANRVIDIAETLGLKKNKKSSFIEGYYQNKILLDQVKMATIDSREILDESYFQVLAEWEYAAVLELFSLSYFEYKALGISEKLGISIERTEIVLNNLINVDFLFLNKNGEFELKESNFKTTEDITSKALLTSHKKTLEMANKKLDEVDINLRDYSSLTIAIDLKKIIEVKKVIREFRRKLIKLLEDGNKTDIYQLSIQFFPLTQAEEK